MRLLACPRTIPTGIQLRGGVPEHWEAKRLRHSEIINDEAISKQPNPT